MARGQCLLNIIFQFPVLLNSKLANTEFFTITTVLQTVASTQTSVDIWLLTGMCLMVRTSAVHNVNNNHQPFVHPSSYSSINLKREPSMQSKIKFTSSQNNNPKNVQEQIQPKQRCHIKKGISTSPFTI